MTERSIDRLRQDAKALKKAFAAGDAAAKARATEHLGPKTALTHADALHVIALETGHASWPRLKLSRDLAAMDRDARAERLKMALFFGQHWVTDLLLEGDPDLPRANFGLACAMFDVDTVARVLSADPGAATRAVAGPRRPILHLAFSHWHQRVGTDRQIACAARLLAAGADANDGYPAEPGSPNMLSALYGALGHAGNLDLAAWLLERGADPNDNESLYHATELGHADGLRLLLRHGAKTAGTNALPRAMDFDNLEMVTLLLEAGADPNEGVDTPHPSGQPVLVIPGLHQAARRMCSAEIAEALIAHGADGTRPYQGHTAYALARMRGNHPVARVLERAGQASTLTKTQAQLAAAADGQVVGRVDPAELDDEERRILHRILSFDGALEHAQRLVALGIDPNGLDEQDMPAIHIAGWEGQAESVAWLLSLGPDLAHINMYGGDLLGTVIHGAEFCPNRARRDHLRCARLVLDAGSPLRRSDLEGTGAAPLAAFLADWAEDHPERVIEP